MLDLILLATVPVFIGSIVAARRYAAKGAEALWSALAGAQLLITAVVALASPGAPLSERLLSPVAIYLPAFLLSGIAYSALGRSRWAARWYVPVAVGVALANLVLAQGFFVMGCGAGLWECP